MQLTGRHTVTATPAALWTMLMDPDTLAKIIPGISRLEKTGENYFKSVLEIKLGPVSGLFTGNLQLENITEPKGFILKIRQNSRIGNADATIKIDLVHINSGKTEVGLDGAVKVTGQLASMGQRVLGGVANMLTKQFFVNLENELTKEKATS